MHAPSVAAPALNCGESSVQSCPGTTPRRSAIASFFWSSLFADRLSLPWSCRCMPREPGCCRVRAALFMATDSWERSSKSACTYSACVGTPPFLRSDRNFHPPEVQAQTLQCNKNNDVNWRHTSGDRLSTVALAFSSPTRCNATSRSETPCAPASTCRAVMAFWQLSASIYGTFRSVHIASMAAMEGPATNLASSCSSEF